MGVNDLLSFIHVIPLRGTRDLNITRSLQNDELRTINLTADVCFVLFVQ